MPIEIVAELSANHNGKLETALEVVHAAKGAGANAIKLQTYGAMRMTPFSHHTIPAGAWKGWDYLNLYLHGELPADWHQPIIDLATSLGMDWFSTPFHPKDVEFLETLKCPRYKISSFSIDDLPLLRAVAKTQKPVVMSTGSASDIEIEAAIQVIGHPCITLLHCISSYPARPETMNMSRVSWLADKFGYASGLSDHSLNRTSAVLAVGQGATMIEKHLCLSRAAGGLDSAFSQEPLDFYNMVKAVREAEQAMLPREIDGEPREFRTSLWCARTLTAGEAITADDVAVCRPGRGLSPMLIDAVTAGRATDSFVVGRPLTESCFK